MEKQDIVEQEQNIPEEEKEVYVPRPKWQIIGAWIGVAIMVVGFLLYCYQIATGGQ